MKRFVAFILALSIVFALCACGSSGPKGKYRWESGGASRILSFSGKTVKLVENLADGRQVTSTGTFVLNENEITILWDSGRSTTYKYHADADTVETSDFTYKK